MIFTRFGSEVKVVDGDMGTGFVDVKRLSDGQVLQTYIGELKADGGISEISDAIAAAKGGAA